MPNRAANEVLPYVIQVLREVTADWDVGEISAETSLGNLGLESINLVYFIAELQQHYGLQDRLFTRLRTSGRPVPDLRVSDVVDLVEASRSTPIGPTEGRQA
jgi:acyl carrier protein